MTCLLRLFRFCLFLFFFWSGGSNFSKLSSLTQAKQHQAVLVLNAGTRRKQIPPGEEAFDVQWGVEGHTEQALPPFPNLLKLTDIDKYTQTHTSPQKQLTF